MNIARCVAASGVVLFASLFVPSAKADIQHLDDVIIAFSLCVGNDCVNGESFGFDTIRMKENNVRMHFDDTSTSAAFPSNDWRFIANDSSNGGASYMAIEDSTAGRQPFRVEAGARVNALYVEADGDIGIGTNNPVADVHIVSGNTPTLRLEQNGSSGFTAQTWDLAGNEANLFIRDATNGSTLPFRIFPGAPSNAINIAADGDVGFGTTSPSGQFNIVDTNANVILDATGGGNSGASVQLQDGTANNRTILTRTFSTHSQAVAQDRFRIDHRTGGSTIGEIVIDGSGNVGVGDSLPTLANDFTIQNGGTGSVINAGQTTFTATSSRTLKENIRPVNADSVLARMSGVPVVTYDWRQENWTGPVERRLDKMGLIAEDFHTIWQRGSDKTINGQEVQMTLWLAVQELHAQNKQLVEKVQQLEQGLARAE